MTKANYPGKVILFGEHSIVYPGHNAVIIPIDLQARAEAEIIQGEQKIIFQEPNSSWFKEPFECTFESAISTYTMLKDLHSKSEYEEIDRALHEDFGFLRALFGLILIEVRKSSENTIPSFGIILKVNIPYLVLVHLQHIVRP